MTIGINTNNIKEQRQFLINLRGNHHLVGSPISYVKIGHLPNPYLKSLDEKFKTVSNNLKN
mgnify:CR=1